MMIFIKLFYLLLSCILSVAGKLPTTTVFIPVVAEIKEQIALAFQRAAKNGTLHHWVIIGLLKNNSQFVVGANS